VTDPERIYQLMILTACADGRVDRRESSTMSRLLSHTPELHAVRNQKKLARAARDLLERRGLIGAVQELAIPIAAELHPLTVACCARVLAADGVVAGAELEIMGQLRRTFGYALHDIEELIAGSASRLG
jgi:hypothetical protein